MKATIASTAEIVQFPAAVAAGGRFAGLPAEARQDFQEGMERLQKGEAAQAVTALSRCVETAPAFPEARIFLGIAHSLTFNIYPAIDQLEEAAKLDHDSFAAHFTLAQLHFKLRIPKRGYEAANNALRCVATLDQRRMLTQLLKEERERERNGIARPWFNKPFGRPALLLAGSAMAAALVFLITHMH